MISQLSHRQKCSWLWCSAVIWITLGVACYPLIGVRGQIIPDNTLGDERSIVNSTGNFDRIDGGAIRDSNLFHSFEQFGIDAGREAYFTNPEGIANIFSRVTGGDRSDIMGTLGVLGDANLLLLNPSGILFGPDATLDIRGAFYTSTAGEITFPDGNTFSALVPGAPPLLTVDVTIPISVEFA
ncbi:MAG: filamentous hemagglutinin N-terminal domain-containing protein, partial [Cyanothece sp. SIO2G6]|nr:filamentous hemagglutinin N-terminal domain-containing protein [Cyanothece sp. SIO2G6]